MDDERSDFGRWECEKCSCVNDGHPDYCWGCIYYERLIGGKVSDEYIDRRDKLSGNIRRGLQFVFRRNGSKHNES